MSREVDLLNMDKTEIGREVVTRVKYIGALEELGLGAQEGIPSELRDSDETARHEYGDRVADALREVTDMQHYGCIDGRVCLHNADGSSPEVRRRQVGGTGLVVEVALNSGASILDTINDKESLPETITAVEKYYESVTGVRRSAHSGGCGGVLGAYADQKDVAENPAVMEAVKAIMEIPEVYEYTGIRFNADSASAVAKRAAHTATWMEAQGWNGATYVEGVRKDDPSGVEELEVGDDKFQGHREPALVLVLSTGEKSYGISDAALAETGTTPPFVVSLDASLEMAKALGGQRGEDGVREALIANLAKHVAVADRLPEIKTPVYLIAA